MRTRTLATFTEAVAVNLSGVLIGSAAAAELIISAFRSPLDEPPHSELRLEFLILILIGVLVMLVVVCIGLCYHRRRHRRRTRELVVGSPRSLRLDFVTYDFQGPYAATSEGCRPWSATNTQSADQVQTKAEESSRLLLELLESQELAGKRIPFKSLQIQSTLSRGASGQLWLCEYAGQQVAVKRLLQSNEQTVETVRDFAEEIALTATLKHPHTVAFIGVAWTSFENLSMVLEYCPMGDLKRCLADSGHLLAWTRDKIRMAIGIARGLQYIHNRQIPIIHRDLKSKNILLTDTLEAKIIDFGASRSRNDGFMTAGVGTPYWTAPEVLEGNRYSEQADIYSFGVVLTELDTCKMPFFNIKTGEGKKPKPFQILQWVLDDNLCPRFSEDCPHIIRSIGTACLHRIPDQRPTAAELVQILSGEMRQRMHTL